MPNELFQLPTLIRLLDEDVELGEALGFPEVSALDTTEPKWRSCLQKKIKAFLEDDELAPTISLHRRRVVADLASDSIELTFRPIRHSPYWLEPVRVRIHFVRWTEGDLHHAFVPALGVHAFATRASLLPERVEEHTRLLLASRGKNVTLRHLAELARVRSLKLSHIQVTAHRKTPKQLALATESSEEKPSAIDKLAEELPPTVSGSSSREDPLARPSPFHSRTTLQAAFELEPELARLAEALAGPHGRSILLVGPPGCGKTTLIHELALRRGDFGFGHTPFWSTNGVRLMTGPVGFGMWQERCQQMCQEVANTHAILHLNHLTELLEVGKASRGAQSVGGFLRPWIARGQVLALAECTPEEQAALERQDPSLLAAFQQMNLPERTPGQTRIILDHVLNTAPGRESSDPTLATAALDRLHQLHLRYATYSANPGRPLRFLKNLLNDTLPDKAITESQVINAFSRETGLPSVLLNDDVALELDSTHNWFGGRVIGQPEASAQVVDLLVMIKARLARPRKPLASFLFIGPTGTGKTEMAKALAEFLFGDPARLVRFDLNEFSDPLSVQRLIGGLAACDPEGLLTARIREQPFSVVLLDEFEKADPSFFDLLLQILGDGRLTDAAGRVADFCNSVIVMTSNLGSQGFQRGPTGFRADGRTTPQAQEHFTGEVRKFLRPEIFNRLDAVVPFNTLTPDVVLAIARRHLDLIRQRDGIRLRPIDWQIEPEVAHHLAARGYDARYGARPLKRAIERELLVPLAEALNRYQRDLPLTTAIAVGNGQVQIQVRARPEEASGGRENAAGRLARSVVEKRRKVSRLQRCRATVKIQDETAILESLERRLATMKWKRPDVQARLAALPRLRGCLQALNALADRASRLETEALGALYQRKPLDAPLFTQELDAVEQQRIKLRRDVFRFQQTQPDDVILAFYSEHRDILLEFAHAYHTLAGLLGVIFAFDYFTPPPEGRSNASKLIRQTSKTPEAFFTSLPENTIAIVLHLKGELFSPRFHPEAGLHVFGDKKDERVCLIETANPPISDYSPPPGIERQGAIKSRGTPVRRTFERAKDLVKDSLLGNRPWTSAGVGRCLAELIEERLDQAIERTTA